MYPQFQIPGITGITVHTFGLALAAGLGMFLWMAYRLAVKAQTDRSFVEKNVLWFILAAVVTARLGYFLAEWRDYKFLGSWFQAVFMSDYNLSLAGAAVGFAGLFTWRSRTLRKRDRLALVDVFVLAFLFAAVIGFVGALLGGQVYGNTVSVGSSWGVTYDHPATQVPGDLPRFPLALVYAAAAFVLFCGLYIAHVLTHVSGLVGYAGLVAFASVLLVGEFFNGNPDMFKSLVFLNLNQLAAGFTIFAGLRGMLSIAKSS